MRCFEQGAKLDDELWSASLLIDNPSLIYDTHLSYFRKGADIATTASYQASFEGFLVSVFQSVYGFAKDCQRFPPLVFA